MKHNRVVLTIDLSHAEEWSRHFQYCAALATPFAIIHLLGGLLIGPFILFLPAMQERSLGTLYALCGAILTTSFAAGLVSVGRLAASGSLSGTLLTLLLGVGYAIYAAALTNTCFFLIVFIFVLPLFRAPYAAIRFRVFARKTFGLTGCHLLRPKWLGMASRMQRLVGSRNRYFDRLMRLSVIAYTGIAVVVFLFRDIQISATVGEWLAVGALAVIWLVVGMGLRYLYVAPRDPQKLAASDARRPVLLLRAFHDDHVPPRGERLAIVDKKMRSIEEVCADVAWRLGPFVAIGAVRRRRGWRTARVITSEQDWRDRAADLVESASLIWVSIASTKSLVWEIEQILERGALEKSLFFVPPLSDRRRVVRWGEFIGEMRERGVELSIPGQHLQRLLAIEVQQSKLVLYWSRQFSRSSYEILTAASVAEHTD